MKINFLLFFCFISIAGFAQKIKSIETVGVTIFYDTLGNPIKILEVSNKKISTYHYKNCYDNQKRLISRITFRDTIEVAYYENKYAGNHLIRSDFEERTNHGLSHRYVLYTYNEMDSLQRKILFKHNGDTAKIISFFYNEDKKLSREVEKGTENKRLVDKQIIYSSLYKTIKEYHVNLDTKDTTSISEKKLYQNKQGDFVKIEDWKTNKVLYSIDDKEIYLSDEEFRDNRKGYVTQFTIDYVYDHFGKWIKTNRYAKGKLIGAESRIITYY